MILQGFLAVQVAKMKSTNPLNKTETINHKT
jgi:hypothetical protein